eukprot:3013991-Pleurochrysis_carterae.AAC.1
MTARKAAPKLLGQFLSDMSDKHVSPEPRRRFLESFARPPAPRRFDRPQTLAEFASRALCMHCQEEKSACEVARWF